MDVERIIEKADLGETERLFIGAMWELPEETVDEILAAAIDTFRLVEIMRRRAIHIDSAGSQKGQ